MLEVAVELVDEKPNRDIGEEVIEGEEFDLV